jgi:hypothetical protein
LPNGLLHRPFSSVTFTDQHVVDRTLGVLPDAVVYEESFIGPKGPGGNRIVAGTVDHIVLLVSFSALGEQWAWDEVMSISTAPVGKIREQLSIA